MLIKEMRGRERSERNNNNNNGSSSNDDDGRNSSTHNTSSNSETAQEISSQRAEQQSNSDGIDIDDIDPPNSNRYESQSISERIQYYFTKFISWYQNQSEDMQTILKVSFGLLLLYIALGGRFGLEYVGRKPSRGNYGHGNHMKDITVTTQQQILLQGIMTDMDMSVNLQPGHKTREAIMQIVLKLKVAAAVDTTIEQILRTDSITRVTHNMMMKNTTNHLVSLEVVGGRVAGHITCQTCLTDLLPH